MYVHLLLIALRNDTVAITEVTFSMILKAIINYVTELSNFETG
jgi:hypothetical protein